MQVAGGGCILGPKPTLLIRNPCGVYKAVEFYIALILALTLAAVAGVLYFYVMFLEARSRQQRRRIAELESANAALLAELRDARGADGRGGEESRELWPEVIDEDSGYSMN